MWRSDWYLILKCISVVALNTKKLFILVYAWKTVASGQFITEFNVNDFDARFFLYCSDKMLSSLPYLAHTLYSTGGPLSSRLLFRRSGLSGQLHAPLPVLAPPAPAASHQPGGGANTHPAPLPLPVSLMWSQWLQLHHLHTALLSQARREKTTLRLCLVF
jgi:hypothetical protein